ncbi:MAG: helix-turn-helix domain-containing protein [Sediminibacterium sp.]|jgi:AraC family 4-hydroxyphenylacetate 3-monooxygenase operon regulatory protein|nr:helix-turn-helix domain-containing protein [Sediminibacterium sp.]
MEKRFYNSKVKAQFTLLLDEENLPDLNLNGSFLKFIWNKGDLDVLIQLDNQEQTLYPNQVICMTYLQHISVVNNQNQVVVLLFNREFYCVHTNDSEVSCNGLLFFGSNQTPIILLNQHEFEILSYLISVLKEEFDIIDGNREEMLRILLKRFIIRCTRLAKQQLFKGDISFNEVDIVRLFNVLVEENYKKLKKVSDYASLMNKSPKTISNIFNQYSELSPLQIIHQRVIIEAKRLFNYTSKSAKEIGQELGFDDAAQFSKFFKNVTGKSISEYRNTP